MKRPTGQSLREGMIKAAHAGGAVLRKYFEKGESLRVQEKLGAGLVTNADFEAERTVVRALKKLRPDFGFLTEEATAEQELALSTRSHGRWIIDPLDGTTNFVHGFPMFCVSLAAEWEGKIVAGVIYHPILRDTYVAVAGKGATVNGRKLKVSKTRKVEDSLLTTGFTYRKDDNLRGEMEAFERLSRFARAVRRPGSAALDLAYVARGVFDGFWERRLSPWDVAAGALIVQEAGGKVTDFRGNPFDIDSRQLLASNSELHEELLKAVRP